MTGIETIAVIAVVGILAAGLILCSVLTTNNRRLHDLAENQILQLNRDLAGQNATARQIVGTLQSLVTDLDDIDADMKAMRKEIASIQYRQMPALESQAAERRRERRRPPDATLH